VLEELERRITPSTGPDLHLAHGISSQIASPNPGLDSNTTVAIDAAGHVAVFWQDSLSPVSGPVLHGEVNGSAAFTVTTAGTIVAASADTAGDVAVLWQSEMSIGGLYGGYYLSIFSATGAPLGGPVHLGTSSGFSMPAAANIAGNSTGHFMAVWEQIDPQLHGNDGAHGQVFDAHGNALSAACAINAGTNPLAVAVAADGAGFVAAWQTDTPLYAVPAGVFGQRYNAAGNAQGSAFLVNATGGQFLHVASDGAGNLVAVWSVYKDEIIAQSHVAVFTAILGQRFTDHGVRTGGVFQVDTTPIPPGPVNWVAPNWVVPAVALDAGDNVEVVYATVNDNSQGNSVYTQRFGPSGSPIGTLARLNPADVGGPYGPPSSIGAPAVAADLGGDFVFGWSNDGNATAALYSGAATNRGPQAITPYAAGDQTAFARQSYYESQSYLIDPDGDPLAYSATLANGNPLPAWLHIDDAGRLWGTPDLSAAGTTYQIKVTAADPWGAHASLVLPLTVAPDPSHPAGGTFNADPAAVGSNDQQPVAAVNSAGQALIVWVTTKNGVQTVMGRVYDAQHNPRGPAFSISQTAGSASAAVSSPTVTADAAGNFDVAWVQTSTDGSEGIYLRQFNAQGAALDNAVEVVPTSATCNQFFAPQLAADAMGGLVLAWGSDLVEPVPNDYPVSDIFMRRFGPKGNALSAAVQIAADVQQCDVAVSRSGNIMVVWETFNLVQTQRFDLTGSALQDTQLEKQVFDAHLNPLGAAVATGALIFQGQPMVTSDGLGNFDVAWVTSGVGHFGDDIAVERFNNLGKPMPNALGHAGPTLVNTTRGNQDAPQVAADGSGNFAVIWLSDQPGDSGVFGRRYDAGGRPVGEFRVAATSTGAVASPAIAANAAGNLLTVWESTPSGAGGSSVAGQWFQPTATLLQHLGTLPSGWSDQDINGSSPAGSARYAGGTWTVAGGGSGIGGTTDRFNFAARPVTGNTTITAELTSFNGTNYSAFAGLMLRSSTASGSLFVDLGYSPQWGAWMQWRTSVNGTTGNTKVLKVPAPSPTQPLWLKLVQTGTTVTGYASTDAVSWKLVGSITVAANTFSLAGLAVTSEYSAPLATATFTNVVIGMPSN
jgi:hypothetical protein